MKGEGQVRVRKVRVRFEPCELKDLDLSYYFVFTTLNPHKLFSWLLRGLDKSDGT